MRLCFPARICLATPPNPASFRNCEMGRTVLLGSAQVNALAEIQALSGTSTRLVE
jgi:hypothetical protein